jgi:hypothetical protein
LFFAQEENFFFQNLSDARISFFICGVVYLDIYLTDYILVEKHRSARVQAASSFPHFAALLRTQKDIFTKTVPLARKKTQGT